MHPSHSQFYNLINLLMKERARDREKERERGYSEIAALTLSPL